MGEEVGEYRRARQVWASQGKEAKGGSKMSNFPKTRPNEKTRMILKWERGSGDDPNGGGKACCEP